MTTQSDSEASPYIYQYPRAANTSSVIAWTSNERLCKVLGIIRGRDPFKGMLALPGGFHDVGKENLEQTAARELFEETRIEVQPHDLKLVCVQSSPARDPREHVIDHVYSVELPYSLLSRAQAGDDAAEIKLVDVRDSRHQWAFDHGDSIRYFVNSTF